MLDRRNRFPTTRTDSGLPSDYALRQIHIERAARLKATMSVMECGVRVLTDRVVEPDLKVVK